MGDRTKYAFAALAIAASCATASLAVAAAGINCVQFVRSTSTILLAGDAWRWWDAAKKVYQRGPTPEPNAVLVFKRTNAMRAGHVAVVASILDRDTVLLNHANWGPDRAGKGRIDVGVPARDCSRRGDWSSICVWHDPSQSFGRPYAISGFVYPRGVAAPPAPAARPARNVAASPR